MALFARKKKTEEVKSENKSADVKPVSEKTLAPLKSDFNVIIQPRITEKATLKADSENVYVFEVSKNATKDHVRKAVKDIYNVIPQRVAIVRNPRTKIFSRGKTGYTPGVKKAYVYLKKGEKIEVI